MYLQDCGFRSIEKLFFLAWKEILEQDPCKCAYEVGGQSTALFGRQFPRPGHQLEGDHIRICVVVGSALGQHMPSDDEELAGDGDNGLVLFHPSAETLELGCPKVIRLDSVPGGFHMLRYEYLD